MRRTRKLTMSSTDTAVSLRHTLATLAYRAEKVLRDVPPDFPSFVASAQTRPPLAIVAHLGDLMEWGERTVRGEHRWAPTPQTSWADATQRFFDSLAALDRAVADGMPASDVAAIVFQGPVADALTHVGQLALLRGMVGAAVRPESYARAHVTVGRVGADQDARRVEFDADSSPQRPPDVPPGG
jgi:hypothetical protein